MKRFSGSIPFEESSFNLMLSWQTTSENDGHPEPEVNLFSDLKSLFEHTTQVYTPSSLQFRYFPVKGLEKNRRYRKTNINYLIYCFSLRFIFWAEREVGVGVGGMLKIKQDKSVKDDCYHDSNGIWIRRLPWLKFNLLQFPEWLYTDNMSSLLKFICGVCAHDVRGVLWCVMHDYKLWLKTTSEPVSLKTFKT